MQAPPGARYLLGVRALLNLTFDYTGIWNESPFTPAYIKALRRALDAAGLGAVGLVAADYYGQPILSALEKDPELRKAVAVVRLYTGVALMMTGRRLGHSSPGRRQSTSRRRHNTSSRRLGVLVPMDCSALSKLKMRCSGIG